MRTVSAVGGRFARSEAHRILEFEHCSDGIARRRVILYHPPNLVTNLMILDKFPSVKDSLLEVPHWYLRGSILVLGIGAGSLGSASVNELLSNKPSQGVVLGAIALMNLVGAQLHLELDKIKSDLEHTD